MSSEELVGVLDHPTRWHRQMAQRLLGDRKDSSIIPLLKKTIQEQTGQIALESLWALYLSGGFDEEIAQKTLNHENPSVRAWTVRLLCDDFEVSRPVAEALAQRAAEESYVQVRSQLACSAKRLPAQEGLSIVVNLLTHDEDASDVHLPLLLWWAIESKAETNRDSILSMLEDKSLWTRPLVQKHLLSRLMRRYAQSGTRNDLLTCARLFELSPDKASTAELMKGFEEAFKGRSLAGLPKELANALATAGGGSITLGIRRGDAQAIAKALMKITDPKTPASERAELIQVFGEVDEPESVPKLLEVIESTKDVPLQKAVLTALGRYSVENIGQVVLKVYPQFSNEVKTVAQTLLASRKPWAKDLLEAVDKGEITADSLPLDLVRQLTFHRDERIAELIQKHWQDLAGASTAEMQEQIERHAATLAEGGGDPYKGKVVYTETCAKCHILFDEGGRIGPNLTTYKRDDAANILANIVNPSAEIREGFESYLILTTEGRTASGFLFDQDNNVVVLRGVDGQNITIPRDEIEEMIPQKKSLMPEGILKPMTQDQVRDLFAYLRSSQPLNN
jgi:putative heme-binding domain-containing protein